MVKVMCCCIELTQVVIGWFGLILSTIMLILLCLCLEYPNVITKWLISLANAESKIDYDELCNDIIWTTVLYIVLSLMNMLTSICLIVGINKYFTLSFKFPFIRFTKKQETVVKNKGNAPLLTGNNQPTQTFNV